MICYNTRCVFIKITMGETIKISPTSVNAKRWGYVETKDADEPEVFNG